MTRSVNSFERQLDFFRFIEEPKAYDGKERNDDLPLFFFAEYKKLVWIDNGNKRKG